MRREGMDQELHPAGTHVEERTSTRGGALAEREIPLSDLETPGEALPDRDSTSSEPTHPGKALPDPTATPPSSARPPPQSVDFVVNHPTQTRFTCPACKLTYTTHHSLVCHEGVSHTRLNLNTKFQCALCEYVNANLRVTANDYRLAHGAAYEGGKRATRQRSSGERETEGVSDGAHEVGGGRDRPVQGGTGEIGPKEQRCSGCCCGDEGQAADHHLQEQVPQSQPHLVRGELPPGPTHRHHL